MCPGSCLEGGGKSQRGMEIRRKERETRKETKRKIERASERERETATRR